MIDRDTLALILANLRGYSGKLAILFESTDKGQRAPKHRPPQIRA